jgi:hypothetical protein
MCLEKGEGKLMQGKLKSRLVLDVKNRQYFAEHLLCILLTLSEDMLRSMTEDEFKTRFGDLGLDSLRMYYTEQ